MSDCHSDATALDLVTVFSSGDSGQIAIAKSLLQAEAIDFLCRGEDVQDLFGWGRFPSRVNLIVGPMQIQVRAEDAENAVAVLSGLVSGSDAVS